MSKERDEIKLQSLELSVGESTRELTCPYCPTGDKEGKSLVVTRISEGLLYKCYRVKCGESGLISSQSGGLPTKKEKQFEPKFFKRPLKILPPKIKRWLKETYYLTDENIKQNGLRYDFHEHRLYMPIKDIWGYELGAECKKLPIALYTGDEELRLHSEKSIQYWHNDCEKVNFPISEVSKIEVIVLVEDYLSAIRVQSVLTNGRCCAILGTNLTDEKVKYLKQYTDHIILALDNDTWKRAAGESLAVKYYNKYSLYFNKFEMKYITDDPKALSDEEIVEQILT